jgi:choice-of-anchor B domain-containing protein
MKKFLLILVTFLSTFSTAQTYPSYNLSLVGMISPNTFTSVVNNDNRRYSGCWGWKHPGNNKEFAIVGGSHGTYFIDISTPASPSVSAFVGGKINCTWREMKTYGNYCYIVSDDAAPNTFQIIDMTSLPSTVTVVHNGTSYFEKGHTIFIDGDRMYIGSVTYTAGHSPAYSSMDVYSLATPTAPTLLRRLSQDYSVTTTVHDMFVKNDTIFASCGSQGLNIYAWRNSVQTFTQLGSYTNYDGGNYNHSSWITANNKYLVFCDEVPAAKPIRLVDVQNMSNVQPMATFNPHPGTTPHNPYVLGDNFAFVACYQDGLNVYNITAPATPFHVAFFDSYPQGGDNTGNYSTTPYRGNWGAYPYLPSGLVICVDMQNGVFILDPAAAFTSNGISPNINTELAELNVYPNPVADKLAVSFNSNKACSLTLTNMLGEVVYSKNYDNTINEFIMVNDFANGTYLAELTSDTKHLTKKITITH